MKAMNMFKSMNCMLVTNTMKKKNERVSFKPTMSSSEFNSIISIRKSVVIESGRLLN